MEYHKGCGFEGDDARIESDLLWPEWTGEVRACLNALRDTEYPGLLSLGMNELVDAILNETPE